MSETGIKPGQIPLAIGFKQQPGFDQFLVGENNTLLECLHNIASGVDHNRLYIWGKGGTGKSHLLQAVCIATNDRGRQVCYIPLKNHREISPEMLEDLEQQDLVCLDDIDEVAGQDEWEQAILHLYNRIRDQNGSMVISSQHNQQASPVCLNDLKSRLAWDLIFQVKALNDQDKIKVLQMRAHAQAFELPDDVAEYLVKHFERNLVTLVDLLEQFAQATLAEQRKLTIPFVKKIIDNR